MPELEPPNLPPDPIAALHKMSTTAGLATQEYVAINSFAVVSVAAGVATGLAFLGALFLIVGVAAMICGVFALRKIRGSNGTQTGAGLAWLGIALAVLISGAVLANDYRVRRSEAAEVVLVNRVIEQMGKCIMAGDHPGAYTLFDPDFQKKWSLDQFRQLWIRQQDADRGFGPLRQMNGNGIVKFAPAVGGLPWAQTQTLIRFGQSPGVRRVTTILQKGRDGLWRVLRMIEIYEDRPTARNPQGLPPGTSP